MRKALIFDFGGTLDYPAHWLDRFVIHYGAAGLELDRAALDGAFTAATARAYRSANRMRELNLEATIRYLVDLQLAELSCEESRRAALADVSSRDRLAAAISRSFADESRAGLAASREVMRRLANRYQLGVVSNFYGNLDRVLDEAGILQMFAFTGDSSRFGSFKPEPAMFRAAMREMAVEPGAVLMVGDSLAKDCAPAHALGMRTAWLRHENWADRLAQTAYPDFTIAALAELEHLSWLSS